ncbi:uncharacterized protein [Rutidosis leptorrhynchoides]|uniref:uncharacterized protein n=1 Tax=Rutidosis leptorrhynchoides TaxID=125765 RepID=UPI003A9A5402
MRIASWNTRGLGNKSRGQMVGRLVNLFHVQFIALQESMVQEVPQPVLNEVWKHFEFDAVQVNASGRSGGLVSMWRTDFFSLVKWWCKKHWIATIMRYNNSNKLILIVNVYAPQQEQSKKIVWSQLTRIVHNWPGPFCLLGDFNSVCAPEERLREVIDHNCITSFNNFISNAGLIDQFLVNDDFTWEGPLGKFSKIDRVFINAQWAILWPNSILQSGFSDRSDHKPIIWGKKLCYWGPKPFRFNNAWLAKVGFLSMCETVWSSFNTVGWASFVLNKNLRLLKAEIKLWNASHQDSFSVDLKSAESEIKRLKLCYSQCDLDAGELNDLVNLKKIKKKLQIHLESKHRIHSRYKWLKLGDKNSRFFHLVSKIKQQSSYIAGMQINNSWEEDPSTVKEFAVEYFESIFSNNCSVINLSELEWAELNIARISAQSRSCLIDFFSTKEIQEVPMALTETKHRGRTGFLCNSSKNLGIF